MKSLLKIRIGRLKIIHQNYFSAKRNDQKIDLKKRNSNFNAYVCTY